MSPWGGGGRQILGNGGTGLQGVMLCPGQVLGLVCEHLGQIGGGVGNWVGVYVIGCLVRTDN